ncbi:hypothetical protein PF010_g15271 [Phytophthora fragariae]|uniref:Uncharacterized protein n=1 Tax=Phytophthora fragariae TaxID=53985 RepID=A0A6G0KUE9_9STRA|nr:hypothetical protein PF003_g18290 [Phytophthora fragariae]KAE9099232.1 hypothetical protein PF010_g15271 [Phytophthora fragariae]KAE9332419.1 hypothetical protein PF008_g14951 [Phytophthora fragariae]
MNPPTGAALLPTRLVLLDLAAVLALVELHAVVAAAGAAVTTTHSPSASASQQPLDWHSTP